MSAEDFAPFVLYRQHRAEKRRARRDSFPGGPGWEKKADTHWQYILCGKVLDYWPGPMKWRWDGRTSQGNVFEFIRKREEENAAPQ